MKISQNFSITEESFPAQSGWIGNLLSPLSSVVNQLLLALQGNLSVGDNITGVVDTKTITTDPSYSTGKFTPIRIYWTPGGLNQPTCVVIGRVTTPSNQAKTYTAISAHDWAYDYASQAIVVNYVGGLANSSTYTITFQCT
jgi:hypothetical protein